MATAATATATAQVVVRRLPASSPEATVAHLLGAGADMKSTETCRPVPSPLGLELKQRSFRCPDATGARGLLFKCQP